MAAEPFLGVKLPDNFDAPETETGNTETAPSGAPEGGSEAPAGSDGFEVGNAREEVSKEGTTPEASAEKAAIAELLDLDKHERFRWQGREWTRKELTDGVLMRQDYTRKTQEAAEARKYVDNFEADLAKIERNPALMSKFREIYPRNFVRMAERILGGRTTTPQPASSGTQDTKPSFDRNVVESLLQEKLSPILDWKEQVEQSVAEAQTEQNIQWLDSQFEKLKTKYPFGSEKEVHADLQSFLAQGTGGKVTAELMDQLYKQSHEAREATFKAHYKKQVEEQQAANRKAKDVGKGASADSKPKSKMTMQEAKKALFNRFDA